MGRSENACRGLRAHRASNISPLPAWFRGSRGQGSALRGGVCPPLPSPTHPEAFRALLSDSYFWKGQVGLSIPFLLLQGSSLGASSLCPPEGPGEPLSAFHGAAGAGHWMPPILSMFSSSLILVILGPVSKCHQQEHSRRSVSVSLQPCPVPSAE